MAELSRIYLDNAATSWPKPQAVYDAVDDYHRRLGTSVGRSGYSEADEVGKAVEEARTAIARLIRAESPKRIIFTFNGTDSLNLAIHGLLSPGDHVVTSVVEHNSVLRPLRRLEKRGRNEVTRIGCNSVGIVDPGEMRAALRPETKLVILTHASNVTGAIQPVAEVGRIVREHGALFLIDAAQTIGHMPVSVAELGADLLAAPGHKGLLGPLGTGVLYIRPGVEELLDCVRQGGTGSASSDDNQPDSLPDKYESGSHNAPGLIGLGAAIGYLEGRGLEDIRGHAITLTDLLLNGLAEIPGIRIYGPHLPEEQIGVVSFTLAGHDPPAVAKTLDERHRVQVRAGYQCAALMHRALGTLDGNGTVRLSVGPFNTEADITEALNAIQFLAKNNSTNLKSRADCPCVSTQTSESGIRAAAVIVRAKKCPAEISAIPGLEELWSQTIGDPEIRIAILDGPVDRTHPSLKSATLEVIGLEASLQEQSTSFAFHHGTHVTSVVFGQPGSDIHGIAPACAGLIRPIFVDGADGSLKTCSQQQLAEAIEQVAELGVNIVNISGGEPSPSGKAHSSLSRAIERCAQKGILVVAAAGNGGCEGLKACDCVHVPGAVRSVLAVGAADAYGRPLEFSNCGQHYRVKGILAPGECILGAVPQGLKQYTGTSFATPIVTGVAALLMSLQRARGHPVDAQAVMSALLRGADPCDHANGDDCRKMLVGRLNVSKAMALLINGDSSMSNHGVDSNVSAAGCGCTAPPDDDMDVAVSELKPAGTANSSVAINGTIDGPRVHPVAANTRGAQTPGPRVPELLGRAVAPSSCYVEEAGDLVYAIGRLSFDFGTSGNLASIQDAFVQFPSGTTNLDVTNPFFLLAYLLGYRETFAPYCDSVKPTREKDKNKDKKDGGESYNEVCGNLHDAKYIQWVLNQDSCPKYVIRPQGAYTEAAYLEIIRFLIEQEGITEVHIPGCPKPTPDHGWYRYGRSDYQYQLHGDCLKGYFTCHGNDVCPCEEFPVRAEEPTEQEIQAEEAAIFFGESFSRAAYIGIAGEICGRATLMTGETVPVISPAMRTSASWNTARMVQMLESPLGLGRPLTPEEKVFLFSLVSTLNETTRNDGRTPEERAVNAISTGVIANLGVLFGRDVFRRALGMNNPGDPLIVGFDGVTVSPTPCKRVDTLPYDVQFAFYDPKNLRPSRVFVTFPVNVADVNPVIGNPRISIRR